MAQREFGPAGLMFLCFARKSPWLAEHTVNHLNKQQQVDLPDSLLPF
jgi:hypothetical protein